MADEQIIYLSPEEELKSVRERLEKTLARRIILVVPMQTQMRSHVSWRLLHSHVRQLSKDVLVISADRQIRSMVKAAGFRVADLESSVSNRLRPSRTDLGGKTSLCQGILQGGVTGLLTPSLLLKQRYRILSLLGKGGFSAVYKVEDIQFGNRLVTPQPSRAKTASPPPVAVELDRAAEQLQNPAQWKASTRSGLFVPEKHFIGADGLPATLQNTQVHAPVPNDWFEKYGLPIEDADVLDQDPDKDGFTNLDEWQGH